MSRGAAGVVAWRVANIQGVVIALPMLAMVLFERRRFAGGGALLGFASVTKLFPGLLLVYLGVRRQWRALGLTLGASLLLAFVALLDMGWQQYAAFADHLPGLVGGEAFPAFRNPAAKAINYSVPGLVFKAGLFGVPGMSFLASKIVGWIWTAIILGIVVDVSRRALRDTQRPLVWMAILVLATLRSPFLPQAYAALPAPLVAHPVRRNVCACRQDARLDPARLAGLQPVLAARLADDEHSS